MEYSLNTEKNNLAVLEVALKNKGIPKSYYSLGVERNERTCVIFEDSEWVVYFFERGRRNDVHKFIALESLIEYLLNEFSN